MVQYLAAKRAYYYCTYIQAFHSIHRYIFYLLNMSGKKIPPRWVWIFFLITTEITKTLTLLSNHLSSPDTTLCFTNYWPRWNPRLQGKEDEHWTSKHKKKALFWQITDWQESGHYTNYQIKLLIVCLFCWSAPAFLDPKEPLVWPSKADSCIYNQWPGQSGRITKSINGGPNLGTSWWEEKRSPDLGECMIVALSVRSFHFLQTFCVYED